MSAIKIDPHTPLHREVQRLDPPWNHIFSSLKHMTLPPFLDLIDTAPHTDVAGVNVNGEQVTFEKFASMASGPVASALYALFGLSITCVSGKIHPHLSAYAHEPWIVRLFSIRFHGEPAIVSVCRREMRTVAEWMLGIMRRTNIYTPLFAKDAHQNTVLHIAVKKRQWEWSQWLIQQGCSPFEKNTHGKTALMYAAPFYEKLNIFKTSGSQWFEALHDALVDGRQHPEWCMSLISQGADVNQPALLDSPVDSLIVFAKEGLDMNISPAPSTTSPEQYKIMFMFGKEPKNWSNVLHAFVEQEWIRFLHDFFQTTKEDIIIPSEYKTNMMNRQIISEESMNIMKKLI